MAGAADISERIAAAAQCLHEHGHSEVADALTLVLAGANDLPAAMGAASGWRSAARIRARDAALRAIVRCLEPGSGRMLAARITAAIGRYHAGAWEHDHRCGRRPADPVLGPAYDFLACAEPLSVHSIRRWLADHRDTVDYPARGAA